MDPLTGQKTVSLPDQAPEIRIHVAEEHPALRFFKKRKVVLAAFLLAVGVGALYFSFSGPSSQFSAQLVPNTAMVVPGDETLPGTDLPVLASANSNTNAGTNSNSSLLTDLTDTPITPARTDGVGAQNGNTNQHTNPNSNSKYVFVHAAASTSPSTVSTGSGRQPFLQDLETQAQGQKAALHQGAPISGSRSTRSGPEVLIFLVPSLVFAFLLVSRKIKYRSF